MIIQSHELVLLDGWLPPEPRSGATSKRRVTLELVSRDGEYTPELRIAGQRIPYKTCTNRDSDGMVEVDSVMGVLRRKDRDSTAYWRDRELLPVLDPDS